MRSFKRILSTLLLGPFLLTGIPSETSGRDRRVRLREPRLKPLPESEANGEQKEALNALGPQRQGYNVYRTMARHPKMMARWFTFASYVLSESTLPPRHREMVILRIGWLCRAEYEFAHHARIGRSVGLSPEEISRITEGPQASGWDPFEAALLQAVDELRSQAFITGPTWDLLARRYDSNQLMDLVITVGEYNLVSMMLNTLGVQLEEGFAGFPPAKDR